MKDSILLFFRGLLMGIADVIPGISGGTIALITGIYSKLVKSLSDINTKQLYKSINFKFFIPLGVGILMSIYLFSSVIQSLLISYTGATYSFFIGLILASTIFLYKKTRTFRFESFIFLIFGSLLAYVISGISSNLNNHSLPLIFFSGALAICAMILPGISGAFILLLLNQYEYLISVIHDLNLVVIGTFSIGALIGLLSFSKILHYILRKYHNLTLSFLIGLMFGSLRLPLQKISNFGSGSIIFWLLAGFMVVIMLEHSFKN
jgi:putative membrane protein